MDFFYFTNHLLEETPIPLTTLMVSVLVSLKMGGLWIRIGSMHSHLLRAPQFRQRFSLLKKSHVLERLLPRSACDRIDMSTLGIFPPSCFRLDGSGGLKATEWEREEEDNRTVTTTSSSATVQHSNVSLFAKMEAHEMQVRKCVRACLRDSFLPRFVSKALNNEDERSSLISLLRSLRTMRSENMDVSESLLTDDLIIEEMKNFTQRNATQAGEDIGMAEQAHRSNDIASQRSMSSSLSSSDSVPRNDGSSAAVRVDMNEAFADVPFDASVIQGGSIATFSMYRAEDVGQADLQQILDSEGNESSSNEVQNWEPLPLPDVNAAAVSPPGEQDLSVHHAP